MEERLCRGPSWGAWIPLFELIMSTNASSILQHMDSEISLARNARITKKSALPGMPGFRNQPCPKCPDSEIALARNARIQKISLARNDLAPAPPFSPNTSSFSFIPKPPPLLAPFAVATCRLMSNASLFRTLHQIDDL